MKNSILVLVFVSQIIVSCGIDKYNTVNSQISSNITESRSYSVFLNKYSSISDTIKINSTEQLVINEVWVENAWKFKNEKGDIEQLDHPQLVFRANEKSTLNEYLKTWILCIQDNCSTGLGSGNIVIELTESSIPDTLMVDVVKLSSPYSYKKKKCIGKILLVKD